MENNKRPIKCFISYSHEDKRMYKKFLVHLNALSNLYNIEVWHDGIIQAGGNIDEEVLSNLNNSDIVFLLISPNYLSSYECLKKELKIAIDRHSKKECIVIPVIIRDFVRGNYPFSKLKYIPSDGKPVDQFKTQNDGFVDALTGIKNLLEKFDKETNNSTLTSTRIDKSKKTSVKNINKPEEIKYKIIKNGKPTFIKLTQNDMDCFIKYSNQLPQLMEEFSRLIDNQLDHFSTVVSKRDIPATVYAHGKNDMESFLLQLFSYVQQRLVGIGNTYVHFRVEKEGCYETFSWVGYPVVGLKTDPIGSSDSIIGCSKLFDIPIIKKYNKKIHRKTHPDETINRNYVTFTFNEISKLYGVNISMCISIVGKTLNDDIFIPMMVLRFDKIIEFYLIRYITLCEKINHNYNIKNILVD